MVGLRLAIERPELVRSLTTFGAGFSSAGNVAGTVESLTALEADDEEIAPMAQMYGDVSPDGGGHFPVVWNKVRRLWAEPFDWSDDLARVTAPVLVMVADDDLFTVGHAEAFARGVAQGQLAVIPGASHLAPIEKPALFNQLVLDFTDDPSVHSMMPQWRDPG
jgi:pimeloyl-ACP methyl ester carboxylesterase